MSYVLCLQICIHVGVLKYFDIFKSLFVYQEIFQYEVNLHPRWLKIDS